MELATKRSITFLLSQEIYALPLDSVKEIVRLQKVTPIPNSQPYIEGVMNLRGSLLMLINGHQFISNQPVGAETVSSTKVIVIRQKNRNIGLLVDQVLGIEDLEVSNESIINGVVKHPKKQSIIRILEPSRLFSELEQEIEQMQTALLPVQKGLSQALEEDVHLTDNSRSCVKFYADSEIYAFPIHEITEILQMPNTIETMPGVSAPFLGLSVMRGEIIPLIDSRLLLGVAPSRRLTRVIIIEIDLHNSYYKVGIAVERVKEVVTLQKAARIEAWLTRDDEAPFISEVYRANEGSAIYVMDTAKLKHWIYTNEMIKDQIHGLSQEDHEGLSGQDVAATEPLHLIFSMDGETYGISADRVKEILRVPPLLPVPQAPQDIAGLANVRGKLVTVVDLYQRLGIKGRKESKQQRLILMERGHRKIGFVVDKVYQPMRFSEDSIQPVTKIGGHILESCKEDVRGCVNWVNDNMVLLLSPGVLFK